MSIGASIFLIAVGAILKYAFTPSGNTGGFNISTVGLILMVVGVIGLLMSLVYTLAWAPRRRSDVVVRDREVL